MLMQNPNGQETRKHSNRMCTGRTVTRPSNEPVSMRPIVDRQTPVKTLPFLAVGKSFIQLMNHFKTTLHSKNAFQKNAYRPLQ